jgi:hypothetical protein
MPDPVTFFLWRRGPLLAAVAVGAAFLIAFAARGVGADEPAAAPAAAAKSSPERALAPVQRLEPIAVPALRRERNRRPAVAPTAAPTAEAELPVAATPEPTTEPPPAAAPTRSPRRRRHSRRPRSRPTTRPCCRPRAAP